MAEMMQILFPEVIKFTPLIFYYFFYVSTQNFWYTLLCNKSTQLLMAQVEHLTQRILMQTPCKAFAQTVFPIHFKMLDSFSDSQIEPKFDNYMAPHVSQRHKNSNN